MEWKVDKQKLYPTYYNGDRYIFYFLSLLFVSPGAKSINQTEHFLNKVLLRFIRAFHHFYLVTIFFSHFFETIGFLGMKNEKKIKMVKYRNRWQQKKRQMNADIHSDLQYELVFEVNGLPSSQND